MDFGAATARISAAFRRSDCGHKRSDSPTTVPLNTERSWPTDECISGGRVIVPDERESEIRVCEDSDSSGNNA